MVMADRRTNRPFVFVRPVPTGGYQTDESRRILPAATTLWKVERLPVTAARRGQEASDGFFDWSAERVVTTPVGQVAVSLASHEDGAVSAVAWLLPVGRRVGYLFRQARQRRPQEEMFDPVLTGTAVRPLMETLLDQAGGLARAEPVADRLVREGRLSSRMSPTFSAGSGCWPSWASRAAWANWRWRRLARHTRRRRA